MLSQCIRDYLQTIADNQDILQTFSFGGAQLSVQPSPKETDWLQNFLWVV